MKKPYPSTRIISSESDYGKTLARHWDGITSHWIGRIQLNRAVIRSISSSNHLKNVAMQMDLEMNVD